MLNDDVAVLSFLRDSHAQFEVETVRGRGMDDPQEADVRQRAVARFVGHLFQHRLELVLVGDP